MNRRTDTALRALDLALGWLLLVVLSPLLAIVALAVRLDSGGPVFHRAVRAGRHSNRFTLYKFRTMQVGAAASGPAITTRADPRVTRVGAFLRRSKLDELPQLFNVVRGDMALVGPRPEDPRLIDLTSLEELEVLSVRPGITGEASLAYRHEEDLLHGPDPEQTYLRDIRPRKVQLDLAYVRHRSVGYALALMSRTVLALAPDSLPRTSLTLAFRRPLIVVVHLALIVVASLLAVALRFDGMRDAGWVFFLAPLPALVLIRGVLLYPFRLYQGLWRYTGLWDLQNLVLATVVSEVLFAFATLFVLRVPGYPRSVFFIDALVFLVLAGAVRLTGRVFREVAGDPDPTRILIVGAGDAGAQLGRALRLQRSYNAEVLGFVDDDRRKHGMYIDGVRVRGSCDDLAAILRATPADTLVIAIPSLSAEEMRALVKRLEGHGLPIKVAPRLLREQGPDQAVVDLRSLSIEDLLARQAVGLDPTPVAHFIRGRRVLVTGAGGSIGSELCRQIARLEPGQLVMLDRYENGLYAVEQELRAHGLDALALSVIADVTREERMAGIFERFQPEIVYHAAAHKHVPLMEGNPLEAVKNNVGGTRVVAELAGKHGASHCVLISTDKAVNPSSVMGATKSLAERVFQGAAAHYPQTTYAAVRFGNVLGSNGSVVPLFLEQIRRGGPVTVTHPEVRRYFMLIPEAVSLVLHASALATGSGEIFMLEMGEQVRIAELAETLIRLTGLRPNVDVPIVFTGLRPGEKLNEELVAETEVSEPSGQPGVRRVRSLTPHNEHADLQLIQDLLAAAEREDERAVLERLERFAPTLLLDGPLMSAAQHTGVRTEALTGTG